MLTGARLYLFSMLLTWPVSVLDSDNADRGIVYVIDLV